MRIISKTSILAAMIFMATLGAASADPQWESRHHSRGKAYHKSKHEDHYEHGRERVIIHDDDRVYIREYIGREYHEHCPPGLAKKHNGCLPPGHAKRYVIGRPLAGTVIYEDVPQPLLVHLQPVPVGYRYVMVDTDVLLISEASKKVIDAVTLLSAVGN